MMEYRNCSIDGCTRKSGARGLCATHYGNAWRRGDELPPLVGRDHLRSNKICAVVGCGKKYHAHGYCNNHAYKFKAHGDPLAGRHSASPGEPLRWIHEHAKHQGDECLKWPFEITRHGYGTIKQDGKKRVASRVMCETARGMPPHEKMEAAHSCGNGHLACMNPRHLRWATKEENCEDVKAHGRFPRACERKSASLVRRHRSLTVADVHAVRELIGTMKLKDIAAMFGVAPTTITKIKTGYRWSGV